MHSDFRIRGADGFDLPFLERVFVIAADWNPATAHGEDHWMSHPLLDKYLGSWREGSDFGFVVDAAAFFTGTFPASGVPTRPAAPADFSCAGLAVILPGLKFDPGSTPANSAFMTTTPSVEMSSSSQGECSTPTPW